MNCQKLYIIISYENNITCFDSNLIEGSYATPPKSRNILVYIYDVEHICHPWNGPLQATKCRRRPKRNGKVIKGRNRWIRLDGITKGDSGSTCLSYLSTKEIIGRTWVRRTGLAISEMDFFNRPIKHDFGIYCYYWAQSREIKMKNLVSQDSIEGYVIS